MRSPPTSPRAGGSAAHVARRPGVRGLVPRARMPNVSPRYGPGRRATAMPWATGVASRPRSWRRTTQRTESAVIPNQGLARQIKDPDAQIKDRRAQIKDAVGLASSGGAPEASEPDPFLDLGAWVLEMGAERAARMSDARGMMAACADDLRTTP